MSAERKPAEIPADETEQSLQDKRLIAVVTEYQRELESGLRPDRQSFISRYPELADAIAECIESVDMLRRTLPKAMQQPPKPIPLAGEPIAGQISKPLGDFQIVCELARGGMGIEIHACSLPAHLLRAHVAEGAEHQYQQAKRAVERLLQVSEEDLINKPEENTRRRILEIVLGFYQDFIDRHPDNAASQAELASVQEKVRGILHELEVLHQDMNTRLLEFEAVQTELKLTPDQQENLKTLLTQWSDERHAFFDQERKPDDEEERKHRVAEAEKRDQSINALLTPTQRKRFQQLGIQWQRAFAFKEPEVVERLHLTVEQRGQIREIERQMFERNFKGGFGPGRGPGPDGPPPSGGRHNDRFNASHMEAVSKILAILNDSQMQAWRELTGEPFTAFAEGNIPDRLFGPPGR